MKLGDIVKSGKISGEVVNLGPNYLTIVHEGVEHRVWTKDATLVEGKSKRNQMHGESLIFKGYRTKNFSKALSENFKAISEVTQDEYALYSCIRACDFIVGIDEKTMSENFTHAKINVDRAKRYLKKFDVPIMESIIKVVDEEMFKFSILEGLQYSTTDRLMIAKVISSVAGVKSTGFNPSNIINIAVMKLKTLQLNQPGWAVVGKMLNAATKAGIDWNRDMFNPSIQKQMELV